MGYSVFSVILQTNHYGKVFYFSTMERIRQQYLDRTETLSRQLLQCKKRGRLLVVAQLVFFILALGMIGIMVQANSISTALVSLFPEEVNPLWTGCVLAVFVGLVLSGGIRRIAQFSESVVPVMAVLFMGGCVVFIAFHLSALPGAVADIFCYAFNFIISFFEFF